MCMSGGVSSEVNDGLDGGVNVAASSLRGDEWVGTRAMCYIGLS